MALARLRKPGEPLVSDATLLPILSGLIDSLQRNSDLGRRHQVMSQTGGINNNEILGKETQLSSITFHCHTEVAFC